MVNYQKRYSLWLPLQIKYADKLWEVEHGYLNSLSNQRNLANNLSLISPISLYDNVMSALAGTDITSFQSFVTAVKTHRNIIIDYIRSKTVSFTLTSFFTPCKEGDFEKFMEGNIRAIMEAKNQAEREEAIRIMKKNTTRWRKQRLLLTCVIYPVSFMKPILQKVFAEQFLIWHYWLLRMYCFSPSPL